jgi:hypothetical protein
MNAAIWRDVSVSMMFWMEIEMGILPARVGEETATTTTPTSARVSPSISVMGVTTTATTRSTRLL